MAGLVASVEGLIVAGAGLPHLPEDFQPALPETAQGAGVGLALGAMGLVVGFGPRAAFAAEVGPQVHGGPQRVVARVAQVLVMPRASRRT